jgi:hypothetical protein
MYSQFSKSSFCYSHVGSSESSPPESPGCCVVQFVVFIYTDSITAKNTTVFGVLYVHVQYIFVYVCTKKGVYSCHDVMKQEL